MSLHNKKTTDSSVASSKQQSGSSLPSSSSAWSTPTTSNAALHSPLGMSTITDHYIKPVPGYTTEYEAAYVWPKQPPASTSRTTTSTTINDATVPLKSVDAPRWKEVLSVCDSLIARGVQVDRLTSLRRQIERRQLDAALEESMRDIKHRVEEQVVLRDSDKALDSNVEVRPPKSEVDEEVLELYLRLVDGLNGIKNA